MGRFPYLAIFYLQSVGLNVSVAHWSGWSLSNWNNGGSFEALGDYSLWQTHIEATGVSQAAKPCCTHPGLLSGPAASAESSVMCPQHQWCARRCGLCSLCHFLVIPVRVGNKSVALLMGWRMWWEWYRCDKRYRTVWLAIDGWMTL